MSHYPGWGYRNEPNAAFGKKNCKATDKFVKCEECSTSFHASYANLGENEFLELETGNESWYCTSCKADCGLCSGAVLYGHKVV